MTKVIHIKDAPSGWKNDPSYVYIGRPSKWGNPYPIQPGCTREQSIAKFKKYFWQRQDLIDSLHELKDKTLVCFCAPAHCHGHAIAYLVDEK
jgi:hypothetical protein